MFWIAIVSSSDTTLCTAQKVYYLLRFSDPADARGQPGCVCGNSTSNTSTDSDFSGAPALVNMPSRSDRDVVITRDGVEQEIKAQLMFVRLISLRGHHELMRAEPRAVCGNALRSCDRNDVRTAGARKLHAHVTEAGQAPDADLRAGSGFHLLV
jgi:hypothetical protein